MNRAAHNLLRIARRIEANHPVLAHDLDSSVKRLAYTNPSPWNLQTEVERSLEELKDLKKTLEDVNSKRDAEEAAAALAKGFENVDAFLDHVNESILKVGSTAGVGDWVKNLFKKKKDPEDEKSDAQYDFDVDAFVEGDIDWEDSSHYVGEEATQQSAFFRGVKRVLGDYKDLTEAVKRQGKSMLSKSTVDDILREVNGLLQTGKEILGRVVKPEPEKKKPQPPAPKQQEKRNVELPQGWKATFNTYADLIADETDDSKVVSYLKKLFKDIAPYLEDERVTISARIASYVAGHRFAGQGGRPDFLLELTPEQKFTSHPSDKIFVTFYNGWSWTHTNVDGEGTHDTTHKNLTPATLVKMIDEFIVPNEAAMEAREYFANLAKLGNVDSGIDVEDVGPSALPPPEEILTEMTPPSAPVTDPWGQGRTYSLLIKAAADHPHLRRAIVPIVVAGCTDMGIDLKRG